MEPLTLIVCHVRARDWSESISVYRTKAAMIADLREAFEIEEELPDADVIEEIQSHDHSITWEAFTVPQDETAPILSLGERV